MVGVPDPGRGCVWASTGGGGARESGWLGQAVRCAPGAFACSGRPPPPSPLPSFLSNLPFVKDNFSAVVLGIVAVSLLPLAWEAWAARREGGSAGGSAGAGAKP